MITAFDYSSLRSKKKQRAVFTALTLQTPEEYVQRVDKLTSTASVIGSGVSERVTRKAVMGALAWTLVRSPRAAVVITARAIPYVGIGLLAYDIYQLFD